MSTSSASVRLSLLLASSFALLAQGRTNPDDYPMYQSESIGVLRNLNNGDVYESVYLQYHGCVWSEYGTGGKPANNGDNGDDDANGGNNWNNGCGADGGDEYWYMGRTQCYRANVAYSLYGIKTGESASNRPCGSKHYINTFFTNDGLNTFSDSAGLTYGDEATTECTNLGSADGEDQAAANYDHNTGLYPNFFSSTTACSAEGAFVSAKLGGAYCSGYDAYSVLDTLDDLNSELSALSCIQVYAAGQDDDGANGDANGDDNGDANGDANNQDGNQDGADNNGNRRLQEDNNGGLFNLVAYSVPCSLLEYPLNCPDPWKVKAAMDYSPSKSSSSKYQSAVWQKLTWMDWVAVAFLILAVILLLVSCCCLSPAKKKKRAARRKQRAQTRAERREQRSVSKQQRRNSGGSQTRRNSGSSAASYDSGQEVMMYEEEQEEKPRTRSRSIGKWFKKKFSRRGSGRF